MSINDLKIWKDLITHLYQNRDKILKKWEYKWLGVKVASDKREEVFKIIQENDKVVNISVNQDKSGKITWYLLVLNTDTKNYVNEYPSMTYKTFDDLIKKINSLK
jgi:hypothetical protein